MAQHVDPNRWRGTVRGRLLVVALLFLTWMAAIQARLVFVQVFDREYWVQKANDQHLRPMELAARRGEIIDRNGELLATSVDVDTLAADPSLAGEPKAAVTRLCAALGDCSAREVETLVSSFRPDKRWVLVRQRVLPEQARRVQDLQLKWVALSKQPWRTYPNRELAAHVLGTVINLDSHGLAGLELRYDKEYLSGRPESKSFSAPPAGSRCSASATRRLRATPSS